jgi:hypothetical protein
VSDYYSNPVLSRKTLNFILTLRFEKQKIDKTEDLRSKILSTKALGKLLVGDLGYPFILHFSIDLTSNMPPFFMSPLFYQIGGALA